MINWNICDFVQGIMDVKSFSKIYLPQISFLGRSNVGKSSLINKLFNNSTIAKTSKKPGKTKEINLFTVDNKVHLLDFPGYGYASQSSKTKDIWGKLFEYYLSHDFNRKRVFCILIDSKVGKKDSDNIMIEIFNELKLNYIEVYTKSDKIKKQDENKVYVSIKKNIDNLKVTINKRLFEI